MTAISEEKAARKNLLALLLEALHHSRHLQAQRVLRQYRHLIARPNAADASSNAGGEADVDY
jgi:hypothetical protein